MPKNKGDFEGRHPDMDFIEALKAMRMGNRVSRQKWRGGIAYWKLTNKGIEQTMPDGATRLLETVIVENILADDWWIVT
jgi:hypothetical protein